MLINLIGTFAPLILIFLKALRSTDSREAAIFRCIGLASIAIMNWMLYLNA